MNIPLVDLKAQYESIKPGIDAAIQSVINDTAFIQGRYVKKFEQEYAEAYGVRHCIGVANGTVYTTSTDVSETFEMPWAGGLSFKRKRNTLPFLGPA